jgi:hypothetical protein
MLQLVPFQRSIEAAVTAQPCEELSIDRSKVYDPSGSEKTLHVLPL